MDAIEQDWQAQNDVRILQEANRVTSDSERAARAAAEAERQKKELNVISQGSGLADAKGVKGYKDGIPQF